MSPEKDNELCNKYPIIYRDRHGSMRETCMVWGFSCSDGWFNLIDEVSAKLEAIAAKQPLPPKQNVVQKKLYPYVEKFSNLLREKRSWGRRINGLGLEPKPISQQIKRWFTEHKYSRYVPDWYWLYVYDYFAPPEDNRLKAVQVKEKFGCLRFYTNFSSPEIDEAIREAERLSSITCETCGEPGKTRGDGWLVTLCERCWVDYNQKRSGQT
jgi:hypothetical protein